jgi:hypothetical protein
MNFSQQPSIYTDATARKLKVSSNKESYKAFYVHEAQTVLVLIGEYTGAFALSQTSPGQFASASIRITHSLQRTTRQEQ